MPDWPKREDGTIKAFTELTRDERRVAFTLLADVFVETLVMHDGPKDAAGAPIPVAAWTAEQRQVFFDAAREDVEFYGPRPEVMDHLAARLGLDHERMPRPPVEKAVEEAVTLLRASGYTVTPPRR